ncbi:CHAP domain-containing protein [Bacillus velezensis]|nr:CHAP domain-containing protein [Bacillus velezensis]
MKVLSRIVIAFLAVLLVATTFATTSQAASYKPKAGDILITSKKVTGAPFLGHAAIVTDDGRVAHISGPGAKPIVRTWASWKKDYPKIRVVRHKDANIAKKAGKYARTKIVPQKASYAIYPTLLSTGTQYCSKLVFQAYYFGNGKKNQF